MPLTQIWDNLIAYGLQLGLLVGIGAGLPTLLRLKVPRARLLYWQLLLVACLALPWLRPWRSQTIVLSAVRNTTPAFIPHIQIVSAPAVIPWTKIALCLLATGMIVRLILLVTGLLKLDGYRRRGQEIPLPAEWRGAAGHARLLLSDDVSGPVTFGFFRPIVLLPAGFPAMSASMRDAILFHELTHVTRHDWLFTLCEEIVHAIFWCHPAVWWVLGEIQLSREQTVDQMVIGMTQARDPYVDTLLAMAGVSPHLDLAPATLFLRRRHLKQRVVSAIQDIRTSRPRLLCTQTAALLLLAAACWFVTGAVPLAAQPQIVRDGPGVFVNLNGSDLMHRSAVEYPIEALAHSVEGTVVVQVRLDANGEVTDSAILSGPADLRKGVQQAILNWHFGKSVALTTQVVNIDFVKPQVGLMATALPEQIVLPFQRATPIGVNRSPVPQPAQPTVPHQVDVTLRVPLAPPTGATVAQKLEVYRRSAEALNQLQKAEADLQTTAQAAQAQLRPPLQRVINSISVDGLSESARNQLLAQLPVHAGDPWYPEMGDRVAQTARSFDSHLSARILLHPNGDAELRIMPTGDTSPVGAQRLGGNVMAANLITQVRPNYPPLAKAARAQGTVRFEATIGKDGTVEDLKVLSGAPLLIQAAMDAVKQWTYKPTLLNGQAVQVLTTIDINFTLAE